MGKDVTAIAALAAVFVLTILAAMGTVALLPKEYQVFGEDTKSVFNPFYYLVMILAFTGVILYIVHIGKAAVVQHIIMAAILISIVYVVYPLALRTMTDDPNASS